MHGFPFSFSPLLDFTLKDEVLCDEFNCFDPQKSNEYSNVILKQCFGCRAFPLMKTEAHEAATGNRIFKQFLIKFK